MKQKSHSLTFETRKPGFIDITEEVRVFVAGTDIAEGLATIFLPHTSASLLIQENADPDVLADLMGAFAKLAPRGARYRHTTEGPDDMPAHIRCALTQSSLSIPVVHGKLGLGVWQAIYLMEHRDAPHTRHVLLHVIGE